MVVETVNLARFLSLTNCGHFMSVLLYRPALFLFFMSFFNPAYHKAAKAFHPLHVSTTELNYNAQDGKLEVSCTMFVDDFELALQKQFNAKADLQKPAVHAAMDILVKNYLHDHLLIRNGNAVTPLNYLGFEINKEAVNVYLESEKMPAPKKVGVEVSLMHNLFADQINIVHISVGGVRKSGKIEYPDKKIEQVF